MFIPNIKRVSDYIFSLFCLFVFVSLQLIIPYTAIWGGISHESWVLVFTESIVLKRPKNFTVVRYFTINTCISSSFVMHEKSCGGSVLALKGGKQESKHVVIL